MALSASSKAPAADFRGGNPLQPFRKNLIELLRVINIARPAAEVLVVGGVDTPANVEGAIDWFAFGVLLADITCAVAPPEVAANQSKRRLLADIVVALLANTIPTLPFIKP